MRLTHREGRTEFYRLECDSCHTPMGWNSDPGHDGRGLTICPACWENPQVIPTHIS